MEKYKVSAVSFLNTYPFLYGLHNSPVISDISLSLDVPFKSAYKLIQGQTDISLVPIAALKQISNIQIMVDYCIASDKKVETVCLYSQEPLENLRNVYLDDQSYTSVELLRILFKEHWRQEVNFISGKIDYEIEIEGNTGGLIIGDRSIIWKKAFRYCYDLNEAWRELTGLPFVYAVWASNKRIESSFREQFGNALEYGLENIDRIISYCRGEDPDTRPSFIQYYFDSGSQFNIEKYLKENVSYKLDGEKRKGMNLFLEHISKPDQQISLKDL
ncbi:MAG: menaquinone biosynthesis protein [Bacteroidetes bacterium]|nr:menaquinone biosynthesis protein [Bacteroidota bacterium]